MLPDKFDSLTLKELKKHRKHIKMQAICYLIDSISKDDIDELTTYYEHELFISERNKKQFTIMEEEEQ